MAAEGAKLATAYFELIPSMRGAQASIAGLVPTLSVTGSRAGRAFSQSFTSSSASIAQTSLKALQSNVTSASNAVAQARLRELDATGKVRVATAALTEVTTKYGDSSSKTIASQERLATAQRGLSSVQDLVRSNTTKLSTAQEALSKAQDSSTGSTSRWRAALSSAGSSIGEGFSDGMRTALTVVSSGITAVVGVAVAGAATIATVTGAALTAGFSRLTTIETAQAKLKALGNTSVDISEIMADANNAVLGTQYSLADAVTAAASAVAAGIKPGQDLTKYLKLQGNAAAVAGVGFSDLGLVMNQVQSQNKAYTQDLNQVASRGIPIFQSLAKVYGTSIDGIRDRLADPSLGVDAAHFREALTLNVGNAADEIGKTTVGSFENMKAAFTRFGAVLLSPVFGAFKTTFAGINQGLDRMGAILKPIVEKYGPKLATAFAPLTDAIGPAISGFFDDIQKAADSPDGQKWFSDMGTALKDIAGALADGLPSVINFTKESVKLLAAVTKLGAQAAPAWIHGAAQITDFGALVSRNLETVTNSISENTLWDQIGAKFANGWTQIVGAFRNGGQQLGTFFAADWSALMAKFGNGWDQIVTFIGGDWGRLVGQFQNGGAQIVAFASGLWLNVTGAFANGWAQIIGGFSNGAAQIGAFTSGLWASVTGAFANGWAQITSGVSGAWANITGAFANGAAQIGGFFSSMQSRIVAAIGNAGSWLFDSGKRIVQGLIDGLRSMIGAAGGAAADVMRAIANFFPHSPAKEGPFSGRGWTPYSGAALVKGFADGIYSGVGYARSAALSMTTAVAGAVNVPRLSPQVSSYGVAGARSAFPDEVTLRDVDGSIIARTRVEISQAQQENDRTAARGFRG